MYYLLTALHFIPLFGFHCLPAAYHILGKVMQLRKPYIPIGMYVYTTCVCTPVYGKARRVHVPVVGMVLTVCVSYETSKYAGYYTWSVYVVHEYTYRCTQFVSLKSY
mgnify:CR=1 FL=1